MKNLIVLLEDIDDKLEHLSEGMSLMQTDAARSRKMSLGYPRSRPTSRRSRRPSPIRAVSFADTNTSSESTRLVCQDWNMLREKRCPVAIMSQLDEQ